MRITHFELLQMALGDKFKNILEYFEAIKIADEDLEHPLNEQLFDRIFPANLCSILFGTQNLDRSQRLQRKMDLSVLRQTYPLWRDRNYFDITPELCARLKDTELRDVDTFFLKTPNRSMYISLPKGNGLFITAPTSGLHEVEGVYLTLDDYEEPTDILVPRKKVILENSTKHLHMLVCGEIKDDSSDALMFFDLTFFEGKVSDSIERNKELLDCPELWDRLLEIFNFITKVLLYTNCANVSIQRIAGLNIQEKLKNLKNVAKKRKLLQKYSRISPQAHKLLDVIITSNNGPSGQDSHPTHSNGPKGLERVRPHFKTQKFGTARAQSKIIWINPYIRGEGAEFYRDKQVYKIT